MANTSSNAGLPQLLAPVPSAAPSSFTRARAFYIDPKAVQNATEIMVTSVDVYFKQKPNLTSNQSGINSPGVTVAIVPFVNGSPSFTELTSYICARREYSDIISSIDASVATNFKFPAPVPCATGIYYAFVVVPDGNEEFDLWTLVQGDVVIGTGAAAIGSAGQSSLYFEMTGPTAWTPLATTDLKFEVYCARFAINGAPVANDNVFTLQVNPYEFLYYQENTSIGRLMGGEQVYVYQPYPNTAANGAVTFSNNVLVAAGNTNFNTMYSLGRDPEFIVVKDTYGVAVRQVSSIPSNNTITVTEPFPFTNAGAVFYKSPVATAYTTTQTLNSGNFSTFVSLANSNANGALRFSNGCTLAGEVSGAALANVRFVDLLIRRVDPEIYVNTPAGSSFTADQAFNYTTVDGVNSRTLVPAADNSIQMFTPYVIPAGQVVTVPSRSNELGVIGSTGSYATDGSNSSVITVDTTITNDFTSPSISVGAENVYFFTYDINNDYTNENTDYGNAVSRHITTTTTFANGYSAEDLLVQLQVWRPAGTDVKVLAKMWNSADPDAFDDKDWTLLQQTDGFIFSATTNANNFIDMSFGLPQYPNTAFTANGVATATVGSANVVGSGSHYTTEIKVGDVVKIYPPLFPQNYQVATVQQVANDTLIVLGQQVANVDVAGSGLSIDKIAYPNQAFRNVQNENVARYFTSSSTYYDTYNSFALKVLLLSSNSIVCPTVQNIRAEGVSA